MSDLQFDEQQYTSARVQPQAQKKGIADLIIKFGLAKNQQQANLVMIGLIVILIIISFFSIRSLGSSPQQDIDPNFTIDPNTGIPI